MSNKILVIDDNREFVDELCEVLVYNGYEVTATGDGTAAFGLACDQTPDVILLDLKMQGIDGFQVADLLRHARTTEKIPIIVMSSYFQEEDFDRLRDLYDIRIFLKKPFTMETMISQIEKGLGRR
jgi:CheY-like chemotaxis protein